MLLQCSAAVGTYDSLTSYGPATGPGPGSGFTPSDPPGPKLTEAIAFSKWVFQLTSLNPASTSPPTVTGWSVSFYGTIDMGAYYMTRANPPPGFGPGYTLPICSWAFLESPAGGAGGSWPNPITNVGVMLYCPIPLVAVRAVAIASGTPVGDIAVMALAVP